MVRLTDVGGSGIHMVRLTDVGGSGIQMADTSPFVPSLYSKLMIYVYFGWLLNSLLEIAKQEAMHTSFNYIGI